MTHPHHGTRTHHHHGTRTYPHRETRTPHRKTRAYPHRASTKNRDAGTASAGTVILTLAILAFAGLVLDAGLAVATKVTAISTAQSSARAGARELDLLALRTTGVIHLNPAQAHDTAQHWLTRAGTTGHVTVTGEQVTVTVTCHRDTQLLRLVGITSIPITARATATAIQPGGS